ncbi:MAG: hypothetical protein PHU25_06295 [Deltaproteobacteria bacterium]|nr:hypothetical protein [Deltaproteobacteria bacterium]
MKRPGLLADTHGIAMTEGVIVIPFFILIWMGLVALHHMYEARLEAQVAAGAMAMDMASSGECGEADRDLGDTPETAGIDADLGGEAGDMLNGIGGCQPFSWSHARVTAEVDATGIPRPLGGPVRTLRGKRTLMCNMKPVDGLIDLVAKMVKQALGLDDG